MNIAVVSSIQSNLQNFIELLYKSLSKAERKVIFFLTNPNEFDLTNVKYQDEVKISSFIPSIDIMKCRFCGTCAYQCETNAFIFEAETSRVQIFPWFCTGCNDCYDGCRLKGALNKQEYIHDSMIVKQIEDVSFGIRKMEINPDERERETDNDMFLFHAMNFFEDYSCRVFCVFINEAFLPLHLLNKVDSIVLLEDIPEITDVFVEKTHDFSVLCIDNQPNSSFETSILTEEFWTKVCR